MFQGDVELELTLREMCEAIIRLSRAQYDKLILSAAVKRFLDMHFDKHAHHFEVPPMGMTDAHD